MRQEVIIIVIHESLRQSSYGRRLSNHHSWDIDIDIDNSNSNDQANQSFRGRRSSRNSRTSVQQNNTNSARNSIDKLRRASIKEIESYHVKQY